MLAYMLIAYGLCFGLQNKFPFKLIYKKLNILDQMLACSYCTGFHCGWLVYLLSIAVEGPGDLLVWQHVLTAIGWGFASAAFCYGADTLIQYLEMHATALRVTVIEKGSSE